jgi:GT2 family glycosyltransferase
MSKVNVVVVNYNTREYVINLINKLILFKDISNIYIVENNSSDRTNEAFKATVKEIAMINEFEYEYFDCESALHHRSARSPKTVNFIQATDNRGFAAGNNIAFRDIIKLASNDEFVWMLNPDITPFEDSLDELISSACPSDKTILGSTLYNEDGSLQCVGGGRIIKPLGIPKKCKHLSKLDFISGAAMFFSVNTLKLLGLMPQEYFLYWEETDWCEKAKQQGIQLKVCEPSKLYHIESVSTGLRSKFQYQIDMRNTIRFFVKYYPLYIIPILLFKPLINAINYSKYNKFSLKPILWSYSAIGKSVNDLQ